MATIAYNTGQIAKCEVRCESDSYWMVRVENSRDIVIVLKDDDNIRVFDCHNAYYDAVAWQIDRGRK